MHRLVKFILMLSTKELGQSLEVWDQWVQGLPT